MITGQMVPGKKAMCQKKWSWTNESQKKLSGKLFFRINTLRIWTPEKMTSEQIAQDTGSRASDKWNLKKMLKQMSMQKINLDKWILYGKCKILQFHFVSKVRYVVM